MKRVLRNFAALTVLVFMFMSAASASEQWDGSFPAANSISIWRARSFLNGLKEYVGRRAYRRSDYRAVPSTFQITPDSLEFDAQNGKGTRQHFSIDLKTLEAVSVTCADHHNALFFCELKDKSGAQIRSNVPLQFLWEAGPWSDVCTRQKGVNYSDCFASFVYNGVTFAAALNKLREFANDAASPLRNVAQHAATWRASSPKPPVPEEIRVQRLLAEDAVKNKKPQQALGFYETGLELYPTWPQGRFNAALIAAELGFYADAVEHMQAYLELVPDSPDAQAARDQVAIWQYKAKEIR